MEKIVLFFALILFAKPAYAYIDPSIGAMFIQGLIAALLLIPFYAKRIIGYEDTMFPERWKPQEILLKRAAQFGELSGMFLVFLSM